MKKEKILFIILVVVLVVILLPILSQFAIVVTNNAIAANIQKRLVQYELPPNTELVKFGSKAGKLTGSGNGMQYMGTILVDSELSSEELKEYYEKDFDFIEVEKKAEGDSCYSIICWDSNRSENKFISFILDMDLRGH